jgi:enamine deaminase RidA (YjgF/YER057c/UK114 family)
MNISSEDSIKFAFFKPNGADIIEQTKDCIRQFQLFLSQYNIDIKQVIKLTFFVKTTSNKEILDIIKIVESSTNSIFNIHIPVSVVTQAPVSSDSLIISELIYTDKRNVKVEHKSLEGIDYLKVESEIGNILSIAGIMHYQETTNLLLQSTKAFEKLDKILEAEEFSFGDIVRQWNYIERIVDYTDNSQHYQIFNDIRSSFYCKSEFPNGYPAATGIGMANNGIVIDILALKPVSGVRIIPLKSPVQADAHKYSTKVLSESRLDLPYVKSSPKFERGKALLTDHSGIIFISGTAAIKGELSISQEDSAVQTKLTLLNIRELISIENLAKHGIIEPEYIKPLIYRVYMKKPSDYEMIQKIINEELPAEIPVLYLQADICRPELVVEIEAVYSLQF